MARDPKPSPVKTADEEVQDMCEKVKETVQEKTSKTYSVFKACAYRTLVDYVHSRIVVFIKVQVGDSEYLHLRIYRNVPSKHGEVTLEELLGEKNEADTLEAFELPKAEAEAQET